MLSFRLIRRSAFAEASADKFRSRPRAVAVPGICAERKQRNGGRYNEDAVAGICETLRNLRIVYTRKTNWTGFEERL